MLVQIISFLQIVQGLVSLGGIVIDHKRQKEAAHQQWQLRKSQEEMTRLDSERAMWVHKHQSLEAKIDREIKSVIDPKNGGQVKEAKIHYRQIVELLNEGLTLSTQEVDRLQALMQPLLDKQNNISQSIAKHKAEIAALLAKGGNWGWHAHMIDQMSVKPLEAGYAELESKLTPIKILQDETKARADIFRFMLSDYYFNLGLCYFEQRKIQKALDHFSKSMTLATLLGKVSLKVLIHNNIAVIYHEMALVEEDKSKKMCYSTQAIQNLSCSLEMRANQPLYRAYLHFEKREYMAAFNASKTNLKLTTRPIISIDNPDEIQGIILHGRICNALNLHEEALGCFAHAIALLPDEYSNQSDRENLWMLCATTYQALGNLVQMRNCYREACCLNLRNREALLPLAEFGDAQAQAYLGLSYIEKYLNAITGNGADRVQPTQTENEAAKKWLQKSMDQNNLLGRHYFAVRYSSGIGEKRDLESAKALYVLPAQKKFIRSMMNLAGIFFEQRDFDQALKYYTKAAIKGAVVAEFQLGLLYHYQLPEPQRDLDLGKHYLELAAAKGFGPAQITLSNIYLEEGSPQALQRALQLSKAATKQGYPLGLLNYACCLLRLLSSKPDDTLSMQKAVALLKAAVALGVTQAQQSLSCLKSDPWPRLIANTPAYQLTYNLPPLLPDQPRGGFEWESNVPDVAPDATADEASAAAVDALNEAESVPPAAAQATSAGRENSQPVHAANKSNSRRRTRVEMQEPKEETTTPMFMDSAQAAPVVTPQAATPRTWTDTAHAVADPLLAGLQRVGVFFRVFSTTNPDPAANSQQRRQTPANAANCHEPLQSRAKRSRTGP